MRHALSHAGNYNMVNEQIGPVDASSEHHTKHRLITHKITLMTPQETQPVVDDEWLGLLMADSTS